jgi:hypothetical protein
MSRENDIRKEVLMQLYAVRPLALSAARLARDARKAGYDYSEREIARELVFLADSGFITSATQPGTTDMANRINSAGVTHYEQNFAA